MKLKAVIMAGGEGSRLRPLTCDCPKPMLPLMGKPLMEYALQLLKTHGITEIAVTLGYLPDAVMDYFGDGSNFGVNLRYYIEKTPLGTAGSVKQAGDFLDEPFIVLSGDGVTDINLQATLDFHRQNDAHATLILKKCSNPQEYGMVVTDADCRILSFHEKPGSCDVFSDRISTGIYILEPELLRRIPENTRFDFGHDLFPMLLREDAVLLGYTAGGYWCDVGDVPAYLRVHRDAMDGKIHLGELPEKNGLSSAGAVLKPGCRVDPPCFIGKNTIVSPGAHIGPYTVIGENCIIEACAGVKRSLLFDHAHIQTGAQLRGCIIGRQGRIGENAQLYEDSVAASGAGIGARAVLPPGVKLWPGKSLPDGQHPADNIVWGSLREKRFAGSRLQLDSPLQAARAVQACCAALKPRELLLGRESASASAAVWHAAAAGAIAQGIRVIDAGETTLPQLRHAQRNLRADAAILCSAASLLPLNTNGAALTEKYQRAVLRRMEHQDFSASALARPMESAGNTAAAYVAHAASAFRANPALAPKIALFAQPTQLLHLAQQAFERSGLQVRCEWDVRSKLPLSRETAVRFADDGQSAFFSGSSGPMDEAHRQLLTAWTALELGETRLLLHNSATRAIELLAADYGASIRYLPGEYALWMDNLAADAPLQFKLQFDGVYSALASLSMLTQKGLSIDQWLRQSPQVYRKTASVPVPASENGRLLHSIAKEAVHAEFGGGIRITEENRWAWLCPEERSSRLQIITESASMEAAADMCSFLETKIKKLLQNSAP